MFHKYPRSASQMIHRGHHADPSPTTRYNLQGEQLRKERVQLLKQRLKHQSQMPEHGYVHKAPPRIHFEMERLATQSELQSPKFRTAIDNLKRVYKEASTADGRQAHKRIQELLTLIDSLLREQQINNQEVRNTLNNVKNLQLEALQQLERDKTINKHNTPEISEIKFTQGISRKNLFTGMDKLQELESRLFNQILSLREDKLKLMKDLNDEIAKGNTLSRDFKKLEREYQRLKNGARQGSRVVDNYSELERETIIQGFKGQNSTHKTFKFGSNVSETMNRIKNLLQDHDINHLQPAKTTHQQTTKIIIPSHSAETVNTGVRQLQEQVARLKRIIDTENETKMQFLEELDRKRERDNAVAAQNLQLKSKVMALESQLSVLRQQHLQLTGGGSLEHQRPVLVDEYTSAYASTYLRETSSAGVRRGV